MEFQTKVCFLKMLFLIFQPGNFGMYRRLFMLFIVYYHEVNMNLYCCISDKSFVASPYFISQTIYRSLSISVDQDDDNDGIPDTEDHDDDGDGIDDAVDFDWLGRDDI